MEVPFLRVLTAANEPVCIRFTSAGVEAPLVCKDPEQIGEQQAEGGGFR